jgi:hypothetical protein
VTLASILAPAQAPMFQINNNKKSSNLLGLNMFKKYYTVNIKTLFQPFLEI